MSERPKCLTCKRSLPGQYADEQVRTERVSIDGMDLDVRTTRLRGKLLGYGYAASGFFCSLTCGHAFAVKMLREGKVTP